MKPHFKLPAYTSFKNRFLRLSFFLLLSALVVTTQFLTSSTASRKESDASGKIINVASKTTKAPANAKGWLMKPSVAMFAAPAGPETAVTYLANCTTPETRFSTGDVVCVKDANYDPRTRAIYWVNPDQNVVQRDEISSASDTSTRTVTQPGVWSIYLVGFDNESRGVVRFDVSDPHNPAVDLSVIKEAGDDAFTSGAVVGYSVKVTNNGPDDAASVTLTEQTPNNTTQLPASPSQGSGPTFNCTPGSPTVCTVATLPAGISASFTFFYQIDAGTPAGTVISNTATVTSTTTELHAADNEWTTQNTVTSGGTGTGTCSVACPDDIATPANTVDQDNNPGAIVHFSPPSGNTECGPIVVDHCNDCFFPQGTTVVTGTGVGDSCSFSVTVTPAGSSPVISCPANQSGNADNTCSASINPGTATATGANVTVVGYRSDGQPMYTCDAFGNCTRNSSDAPFSAGVTTITWYAYSHDVAGPYTAESGDEESHRTGSTTCTQTITVNDVTPPTISATNSSASADANCQAPVPDYSNTVDDNCACSNSDTTQDCQGHPHITYTQSPAAGTMVGLGPHTVHITANDNSSNNNGAGNTSSKDVTFTVNDTTAPVITCPSNISNVPTEPGTCAAHVTPGTATATDNCDSTPTITASRSDGRPLTDTYPKGTTTITWTATDDAGNSSSCTQTITVVDNEPPVIHLNGQTPSMWPPNHKYQTFAVTNFVTSVTDNCDSIGVSSVFITKVTSDEIENGNGDGNTMNDIIIAANCKSIQLRSEREGNGDGRVYTIYFKVVDSSGNVGTATAKVVVQHNPGETAVDSGTHYTVMSACP